MNLKRIIHEQKVLAAGAIHFELVLPGEPLIYSIKHRIGGRDHSVQFFRNKKWYSFIKCHFPAYLNTNIAVVLVVRFYVSPPSSVNVKAADLKREKTMATKAYETCDYLLSFLEILRMVLFGSYRQIVKIDAEKYYSSNPRTTFKFMKWDYYANLQDHGTIYPKGETISPDSAQPSLQPERQGHDEKRVIRPELHGEPTTSDDAWPPFSDRPLPDTSAT